MKDPQALRVGGQAVLEGVMMRSPGSLAVAVRRPSGELAIREDAWHSAWQRWPMLKWPLLRGSVVLVEALHNGIKALNFSAAQTSIGPSQHSYPDPTDEARSSSEENPEVSKAQNEQTGSTAIGTTIFVAIVLAFGLFVATPHFLVWLLGSALGWDALADGQSLEFHLTDGIIKMGVFVGYLMAISRLKEIGRVFMYHGAEHKCIAAFEKNLPLEVFQVRVQSRFHPRCGTSFLLLVILISIGVFSVIFPFLPTLSSHRWLNQMLFILVKIPLMLPVAGLAYEAIRLGEKFQHRAVGRVLVTPGLWFQRLTTREPTDDQIEVALAALRKTLWRERVGSSAPSSSLRPEIYRDFSEFMKAVS